MNRVTITVVGFVMFLMGFLSLLLGMIGLSLSPLMFIEKLSSPLWAFVIKLLILIVGFILIYMGRMSEDESPEIEV